MLIEFKVKNFKSIKNQAVLSMVANNSDNIFENNIFEVKELAKDRLLKTTSIYGANASGKTNLFKAFHFFHQLVLKSHGHQKGALITFSPFKIGNKMKAEPTEFEVSFVNEGTLFNYKVSYTTKEIVYECLKELKNKKEIIIFLRNKDTYQFDVDRKIQTDLSSRTLENMLYLSKATQERYSRITKAFLWFEKNLQIGTNELMEDSLLQSTIDYLHKHKELIPLFSKELRQIDLGIEKIMNVEVKELGVDQLPENMLPKEIMEMITQQNKKFTTARLTLLQNGQAFDLQTDASDGTKRYFSILGPVIDTILKGGMIFIDELEIRLHPMLCSRLIRLFQDPEENKKNAQLVFTTHNAQLLGDDLLRRDQVWIAEKNKQGETEIYSIGEEFKPRNDKNLEKGYLAGEFGGIPKIKEGRLIKDEFLQTKKIS